MAIFLNKRLYFFFVDYTMTRTGDERDKREIKKKGGGVGGGRTRENDGTFMLNFEGRMSDLKRSS